MDYEVDAPATDVIAMNLALAAIEAWLPSGSAERGGETLGREVGALYREIHAAVVAATAGDAEDDEDAYDDEEDDEEDEDARD